MTLLDLPDELLMQVIVFLIGEKLEKHHALQPFYTKSQEMIGHYSKWRKAKNSSSVDYFDLANIVIPICGVNQHMRNLIRKSDGFKLFWRRYIGQTLDMTLFLVNAPKRINLPKTTLPDLDGISCFDLEVKKNFTNLQSFFVSKQNKEGSYFYSIEVELMELFCQLCNDIFGSEIFQEIESLIVCFQNLEKLNEILKIIDDRFPNVSSLSVLDLKTNEKNKDIPYFEIRNDIRFDNLKYFTCPSIDIDIKLPEKLKNQLKEVMFQDSFVNKHTYQQLDSFGVYNYYDFDRYSKNWVKKFDSSIEFVHDRVTVLSAISENEAALNYVFSHQHYFSNLRELYLSTNFTFDFSINLPHLEILSSSGTITLDGVELPKLWKLGSFSRFSVIKTTEKQEKLPNLKYLAGDIDDCNILKSPNLEKLELYTTNSITLSGLTKLKFIYFTNCPNLVIDNCSSLEFLNADRYANCLTVINQKRIGHISFGKYSDQTILNLDCERCEVLDLDFNSKVHQFNVKHISKLNIYDQADNLLSDKVRNTTVDELRINVWYEENDSVSKITSLIQEFKKVGKIIISRENTEQGVAYVTLFDGTQVSQVYDFLTTNTCKVENEIHKFELPLPRKVSMRSYERMITLSKCIKLEKLICNTRTHCIVSFEFTSLSNLKKITLKNISLFKYSMSNEMTESNDIPENTEVIDLSMLPLLEKVEFSNCAFLRLRAEKIKLNNLRKLNIFGNTRLELIVNQLELSRIQSLMIYNNQTIEKDSTFTFIPGNHLIFKLIQSLEASPSISFQRLILPKDCD